MDKLKYISGIIGAILGGGFYIWMIIVEPSGESFFESVVLGLLAYIFPLALLGFMLGALIEYRKYWKRGLLGFTLGLIVTIVSSILFEKDQIIPVLSAVVIYFAPIIGALWGLLSGKKKDGAIS